MLITKKKINGVYVCVCALRMCALAGFALGVVNVCVMGAMNVCKWVLSVCVMGVVNMCKWVLCVCVVLCECVQVGVFVRGGCKRNLHCGHFGNLLL